MIKEAKKTLPSEYRRRITYKVADTSLIGLPKNYDLLYSYIVFQHIPVQKGEQLAYMLLDKLEEGGFAALHFTYQNHKSFPRKFSEQLRGRVVPLHYLLNVLRRRPFNTPLMRMHLYNLDKLFSLYRQHRLCEIYCSTTMHGDYEGLMLVSQKQR